MAQFYDSSTITDGDVESEYTNRPKERNHVYCRKCLVKQAMRDQQQQQGQVALSCPICIKGTESEVPHSHQSPIHVDHVLVIQSSSENIQETARGMTTGITPEETVTFKCSQHTQKELEIYCETCEEVICFECLLKGGKHQGHNSITLKRAFDKYHGEITSSLEQAIKKQLKTVKSALAGLDARCEEISDKQAAVEDDIHNAFRQVHKILDARKIELIGELHQTTKSKLKDLTTQRDQIEITQTQLSSCLDVTRKSLRKGRQEEAFVRKHTVSKLVKELTDTYCQPDKLKPKTEADMAFSASISDVSAVCQNYGKLTLAADPSKCYIKDIKEEGRVGKKTTALLQTVNSKNEPCEVPTNMLECELVSEINGTTVQGSVEKREENQYKISYKPTIKGKHQLRIKVKGHHIRGSPFTVACTESVENLGTPIEAIPIVGPAGLAVNKNGEIIVSSETKSCVNVLSLGGDVLQSFGTHGSAEGQFNFPSGVAVDDEGNILVTDFNNYRIQIFTRDGDFFSEGTKGDGPLRFRRPWGIAFNATNDKVYVSDNENCCVQVLNSDLTFSSIFGKSGSGKGQFIKPCGVACDSTGKVYVADGGNHRIQVFSAKGDFLRIFGKRGQGRGELSYPVGVAVDTDDRVYVSEWDNHRVSVFTSGGQFLTSFGEEGDELGELNHPYGLAVDSSGVVYVSDNHNNRIQLF